MVYKAFSIPRACFWSPVSIPSPPTNWEQELAGWTNNSPAFVCSLFHSVPKEDISVRYLCLFLVVRLDQPSYLLSCRWNLEAQSQDFSAGPLLIFSIGCCLPLEGWKLLGCSFGVKWFLVVSRQGPALSLCFHQSGSAFTQAQRSLLFHVAVPITTKLW